jgi:hypothetical protein
MAAILVLPKQAAGFYRDFRARAARGMDFF